MKCLLQGWDYKTETWKEHWHFSLCLYKKKSRILKHEYKEYVCLNIQFNSVQSLSPVRLFATPWTAAHQASLTIINSRSPSKPMSIEWMMPFNHLILQGPLLLLPPIFPSTRVFFNESAIHIRWPKYWSLSFSIVLPMNTQDWSPLGGTGWISLLNKGLSLSSLD